MPENIQLGPALQFLAELRQNNHKAWFEAHRADYEAARGLFEQFIQEIIDRLDEPDRLGGLSPKDCIPRIYRDIRFSKDKSPYKTNFGALIAPGGWKSATPGYYVSIEPGGRSIAAGGWHNPEPAQLNAFRQAVSSDAASLQRILDARAFKDAFGSLSGERLKTAPKGYDPAHPAIDLLRLRQVTAVHPFSDAEAAAPGLAEKVVPVCRAMRPFLEYLDELAG